MSPGPVSKRVDSANVASGRKLTPVATTAAVRGYPPNEICVRSSSRTQRWKVAATADLHLLRVEAHNLLWNTWAISWQVREAVPLGASRDGWHREWSKTRRRCCYDVQLTASSVSGYAVHLNKRTPWQFPISIPFFCSSGKIKSLVSPDVKMKDTYSCL